MEIPSIAMIPSAYKSGLIYSPLPIDGAGDLNFTRSTQATRVNSSGEIELMGINIPRLDFSDGSGSILLEPTSRNLIQYSENFSQSYWQGQSTRTAGFLDPTLKLYRGTTQFTRLIQLGIDSYPISP